MHFAPVMAHNEINSRFVTEIILDNKIIFHGPQITAREKDLTHRGESIKPCIIIGEVQVDIMAQ